LLAVKTGSKIQYNQESPAISDDTHGTMLSRASHKNEAFVSNLCCAPLFGTVFRYLYALLTASLVSGRSLRLIIFARHL